jgi:hypothetical protein
VLPFLHTDVISTTWLSGHLLTLQISGCYSSLLQVIPFISILKEELRSIDESQGVISAKESMLEDMSRRFESAFTNRHYYVATLLDPRFKDRFLDHTTVELAIDHLEELCAQVRVEVSTDIELESSDSHSQTQPALEADVMFANADANVDDNTAAATHESPNAVSSVILFLLIVCTLQKQ